MTVSISIMAHPLREAQAKALQDRLDCIITWDMNDNEWDTGKRALRHNPDSDWTCVIQDDAIIGENFLANLRAGIDNIPSKSLISLYTGTVRPQAIKVAKAVKEAKRSKSSWLEYSTLLWGVCIVIPTEDVEQMLYFTRHSRKPYDARIGEYYSKHNRPVYYLMPSIVDHDYKLPSLTGHDKKSAKRVARYYSDDLISCNQKIVEI